MTTALVPKFRHKKLLEDALRILAEGRARALAAVEPIKVQTYWKLGKRVNDELRIYGGRAGYGEGIVEELAPRLGMSDSLLWEIVKFPRLFKFPTYVGNLEWSHFRILGRIEDSKKRRELLREAVRKKWSVPELRRRISGIASAASQPRNDGRHDVPPGTAESTVIARTPKKIPRPPQRGLQKALSLRGHEVAEAISGLGTGSAISASKFPPLTPRRGEFFTYRIVKTRDLHRPSKEILGVDLGFSFKHFPSFASLKNPRAGEIVRVVRIRKNPQGDRYRLERSAAGPKALFTYKAYVSDVVDDDTLWVDIDPGFRNSTEQKLRLRGINAAEVERGKPASDFVKRTLAKVPFVVITVSGREKFGRPLVDLFYLEGTDDKEKVLREGIFLNQQLLDLGLAVRV